MCSKIFGTSPVDLAIQAFFLLVFDVVRSLGFVSSIGLIGLLPLYLFLYCFWTRGLSLKNPWVVASLALSVLLVLFLSSAIWMAEVVMGMWG